MTHLSEHAKLIAYRTNATIVNRSNAKHLRSALAAAGPDVPQSVIDAARAALGDTATPNNETTTAMLNPKRSLDQILAANGLSRADLDDIAPVAAAPVEQKANAPTPPPALGAIRMDAVLTARAYAAARKAS